MGKTNVLLNLMSHQADNKKISLYAKDHEAKHEAKHHLLINKCKSVGLKYCHDPKAFIEYSNDMSGTHENIEVYNPNKKCNILIMFDMMADMLSNKQIHQIMIYFSKKTKHFCFCYTILFCCNIEILD